MRYFLFTNIRRLVIYSLHADLNAGTCLAQGIQKGFLQGYILAYFFDLTAINNTAYKEHESQRKKK